MWMKMDENIVLVKESTYIYESKIMKMDYNIALVKKNYESKIMNLENCQRNYNIENGLQYYVGQRKYLYLWI